MTTTHATAVDRAFALMGTTVRLIVAGEGAAERADAAERLLRDYDARLSRFREDSELSRLNRDPRRRVRCSALLRDAVAAALRAAQRTEGLVDPTLLDALEAAGYDGSFVSGDAPPLAAGLETVAAAPRSDAAWRSIRVHDATASVLRPPGVRLDLGGTGKGHAADLASACLEGATSWVVDCGGDLRVGGDADVSHAIDVEDPRGGPSLTTLHLGSGAIATSSIHARAWRTPSGERAHHLLDPATGRPVHTAITAATALAPTALEAEMLAKAAVLTGDPRWLETWGGVAVGQRGVTEVRRRYGGSPGARIARAVTHVRRGDAKRAPVRHLEVRKVRRPCEGDSPLHLGSTVVTRVRRGSGGS